MSPVVPPGPDGRHGPHLFVADLERPELTPADRHHLERVLRLRAGDDLTVGDGDGRWRMVRFAHPLDVAGPILQAPPLSPQLTVAVALTKGDKPELAVQKLTELGVDEVLLFSADRSVVRWDATKRERNLARLRQIARAAAEQSRRVRLPRVDLVDGLAAVVERHPTVVRADRGGTAPGLGATTVAVGPEGGWSEAERALVPAAVALGGPVLRAETAAVTAGALLAALRLGIVSSDV